METKTLTCPSCKNTCFEPDVKCEICGYPLKGTDKEKAIFIGQKYAKKNDGADTNKKVAIGRVLIFAVASIQIVFALLLAFYEEIRTSLAVDAVVSSCIFILFGLFAKRKPIIFFCLALFLLCFHIIINMHDTSIFYFTRVLWRILLIDSIIKALASISLILAIISEIKRE